MIKYEFTEQDYKQYLKNKRLNTNIIFLIIGTIIYFYITYYLILSSPLESFGFFALYLVVLIIVMLLFNGLYYYINTKNNKKNHIFGKYELNFKSNKIEVRREDNVLNYENINIKKVVVKKNFFIIKYSNRISLLLMKKYFESEEEYEKIIKQLKNVS